MSEARPGAAATSSRPVRAPVQLPPAPPVLLGRTPELARLDEIRLRSDPAPSVVVLTGVGGIGKTALALHWLHAHRTRFPDGILCTRFSSEDSETAESASGALHGFLTALGIPADDVPASLAQRAAEFRAVTTDRRFAVLLDDVRRSADARAVLPSSPNAFVLVTSRSQLTSLTLDGAEILPLEPLPDKPAREVLARRSGERQISKEDAENLLSDCAGLPLALTITGARLRVRPKRNPHQEARRGRTRRFGDFTDLATVFDASYAALDDSAARLYRTCGILPGPHHAVDALADTLQSSPAHLDDAVDELIEANLLHELEDETVAQHDVVRHDARVRSERQDAEADRDYLLHRYTRWYRDQTVAASTLIHPFRPNFAAETVAATGSFADRDQAVRWWRRDRPVINAVANAASAHGWDEELWQLAEASWGFFLHHRDYEPFLKLCTAGLAAARRCQLPLVEARMHSQIGYVHERLQRFEEAAAHHAAALEIGEREQHGPTQATALSRMARDARARGDLEAALDLYERSAEKHAEIDRPRGVAMARRRRGDLLATLGREDDAVRELTEAAAFMEEVGDASQLARTVVSLAAIHARRGDYHQARAELVSALEGVERLQSPHFQAEVLTALAGLERGHGDEASAERRLEQARLLSGDSAEPPH
ncbi:tetratricopeptide repeat protein [Amycolatopsis rubida]|uniref:Tetratricopeptide repeat protein n=1 Tax=Amycolatopsis rubida TaxID=112413 RepID=A0ABX0C5D2_9PSEU|nr:MULTISPECIES: tetratricopeptide repeat protein [Amycolatopsis]MYW96518.1 tetratricopeptide repeat protein [Amycolatopsis rubida]NEC61503.1 tetratricopeptide repeat protein [Amycolatopsis rubida]OAP25863.1 Regulatory protein AfsR [Amycolatopsis sp. M39]